MKIRNFGQLRDANLGLIFQVIHYEGPLSRTELAERTGLAHSTVSVITGELHERSLIREAGTNGAGVGRPAVLLEVKPDGGYFLSADLGSGDLLVAVVDLSLKPVFTREYKDGLVRGEALYDILLAALRDMEDYCMQRSVPILGIGVACPGLITQSGHIIEADNLGWNDFALKDRLEHDLPYTVVVENDANAAASGAFHYGLHRDNMVRNMIYVSIGTGIGCGLILRRELFSGSQGLAGEFGHIHVEDTDSICSCGRTGCLEAVASIPAMARRYHHIEAEVTSKDIDDFMRGVQAGDPRARTTVIEVAHKIGNAIGNQINLLNVDCVVLGGRIVRQCDFFIEEIERAARTRVLPRLQEELTFRNSTLGANAGVIGIASLSLLQVFSWGTETAL